MNSIQQPITKLIIPLAGLGTRFLPVSKVLPKEMFLLVNKPVLQYIVEEAHQSGIKEIIFVLNSKKNIVTRYFSSSFHKKNLKEENSNELNKILFGIKFHEIKKNFTLGDGHSILFAKNKIGSNEPFAVSMGDLLSPPTEKPFLSQLIEAYRKKNSSVVSVQKAQTEDIKKFGVISVKETAGRYHLINGVVEKPDLQNAPSNLILTGKYILKPDIFVYLDKMVKNHKDGEVKLADALKLYSKEKNLYGYECKGNIQDTGNKLDFLKATVSFGLGHPEFGTPFKKFIKSL